MIFHDNLYLKDHKIVIKMPFGDVDYKKLRYNVIIESFDLSNKIILSYD